MAIRVTETGAGFEELIGGHEVTAMRHNIKITAGTALKRGSISFISSKIKLDSLRLAMQNNAHKSACGYFVG